LTLDGAGTTKFMRKVLASDRKITGTLELAGESKKTMDETIQSIVRNSSVPPPVTGGGAFGSAGPIAATPLAPANSNSPGSSPGSSPEDGKGTGGSDEKKKPATNSQNARVRSPESKP